MPVASGSQQAGPVTLGLRPDDLRVSHEDGQFEGQVSILEPLGSETLVYVSIGNQELIARASGRTPPKLGATVKLSAEPENMHLFDTLSGNALR